MRPYNGYYEDFDEFEELSYARSQALHKLLEGHRRDERQREHHRDYYKPRHQREEWELDDDDNDWDSYIDDICDEYSEDSSDRY